MKKNKRVYAKSMKGRKLSDATKAKMSAAQTKRFQNLNERKRISENPRLRTTGKTFSEEHKTNIGKTSKGRIVTAETRAKISANSIGKTRVFTEEHKAAMREASRNRKGRLSSAEKEKLIIGSNLHYQAVIQNATSSSGVKSLTPIGP